MSQLKLSDKLINDIQAAIVSVDDSAGDAYVMLQYLAAIQGYVVGRQQIETSEKYHIQEELNAFSKHVLNDIDSSMKQHRQQASGEALGIWRPGDG